MPRADVNGIDLEYVTRGRGEPIVFVHHGAGVDWFDPLRDDPTLSDRFCTITYHRAGYEGSGQGSGGRTVQVNATDAVIAFRGLGGTRDLAATARFDISNPQAGACHTQATPSPVRCLRVQVSVAGQIRMCDPSVTGAGDTRVC